MFYRRRQSGRMEKSWTSEGEYETLRLLKEVEQGLDPAWMCQLSTKLWDQAPNLSLEPQSQQGNLDLKHHICTEHQLVLNDYVSLCNRERRGS